jgi:hypothetical protein
MVAQFTKYWSPVLVKDEFKEEFKAIKMSADERIQDYDLRKMQAFRRAYPNRDPATDSKYVKAFRKSLSGDYGEYLIKKGAMRRNYEDTYRILEDFQEKRILAKKYRARVGGPARGNGGGAPADDEQAPPGVCRVWFKTGACPRNDKRNCDWAHPKKFKKNGPDNHVKKDDKKDDKKKLDIKKEEREENPKKRYRYSNEELRAVPCVHKDCPGNRDDHCARDCAGWGPCRFCGPLVEPHWHASPKKCPKNKFHKKGKFVAAVTVEKDGDLSKK